MRVRVLIVARLVLNSRTFVGTWWDLSAGRGWVEREDREGHEEGEGERSKMVSENTNEVTNMDGEDQGFGSMNLTFASIGLGFCGLLGGSVCGCIPGAFLFRTAGPTTDFFMASMGFCTVLIAVILSKIAVGSRPWRYHLIACSVPLIAWCMVGAFSYSPSYRIGGVITGAFFPLLLIFVPTTKYGSLTKPISRE